MEEHGTIIFADGTEMPCDFLVAENAADICFDLCETNIMSIAEVVSNKNKLKKIIYEDQKGARTNLEGFTALRFLGTMPEHTRVGLRKERLHE